MCVACLSGWFGTAPFRALCIKCLTFCEERFAAPRTPTFAIILPRTSLYDVCHCLIVGRDNVTIGTWNIRTLRPAGELWELTHEMDRYRWNILGL